MNSIIKQVSFLFSTLIFLCCQNSQSVNSEGRKVKEIYFVEFDHTIAEIEAEKSGDMVSIDISIIYNHEKDFYHATIKRNELLEMSYFEIVNNKTVVDSVALKFTEPYPELLKKDYRTYDDHSYLIDTFFEILKAFKEEDEKNYNRVFG